jgi:hypothetical protein
MDDALRRLREEISAGGKAALMNSSTQEKIVTTLALVYIYRTANRMQHELVLAKGGDGQPSDPAAAWNCCMADLVLCSKFHCLRYMLCSFSSAVSSMSQGTRTHARTPHADVQTNETQRLKLQAWTISWVRCSRACAISTHCGTCRPR